MFDGTRQRSAAIESLKQAILSYALHYYDPSVSGNRATKAESTSSSYFYVILCSDDAPTNQAA